MKVYQVPEGVPNIKDYFPLLDWSEIIEWTVLVKDNDGETIGSSRVNKVGCCCTPEKVRVHFINCFGQSDALNFIRSDVNLEVKSENWEKALKFPLDKKLGGSYRMNISSNETFDVETKCYDENDQDWIAELIQSPLAWIETYLPNGFGEKTQKELIPIRILDMKFPLKKSDKRYEYLVKVKFEMSNANINFR